jgi:hypothetical protein
MDARTPDQSPIIIDLGRPSSNNLSTAEKIRRCERDIETIQSRIQLLQNIFSRFDEEDDVKHHREQQAAVLGYVSLFLTFTSLILWIAARSVSDPNTKSTVDNWQTADMIAGILLSALYLYRKTAPDGWPIKLRVLTCSLSSDDLQSLNELISALRSFKSNLAHIYTHQEHPEYKIAHLIDGNMQSILAGLENKAVTIHAVKQIFVHVLCVTNASQALFQKTFGYEPLDAGGHTLTLFAPATARKNSVTDAKEMTPLIGLG